MLAVASVLTVVAAALLVLGGVWWSAKRADQAAKDRLYQTVSYAVAKTARQIPYDQESVAYWDDAVVNTRNAFNEAWADENLGVWMFDYFKHDRTNVLDTNNRIVYAMADGKKTSVGDTIPNEAITALAKRLRSDITAGALDTYEAGKSRIPRAVDVGLVEGRPAVVSVMSLVPHTAAVKQARGSEFLIASVRFLDQSFITDLAEGYQLEGVRFTRARDVAKTEQSYPLTTAAGATLGRLVWAPKLPGTTILSEVLPVLAGGLFGVAAAMLFLIRGLRRTYSDLVSSEAQAKHLAFHDTLTGLPNRGFFKDRLEDALGEVRAGRGQLALIFLDLDRFKQVNDTLGHAAGDALIRKVAGLLRSTIGPDDTLARMGGDEFAILIRDIKGRFEIEALCHRIVGLLARPMDVLDSQASVGVSIGVSVAPADGVDRSELFRKADIALYQAKRTGGQGFEFFDESMNQSVQQRRDLEIELKRALVSGDEFEVVYQPVYGAERRELAGVEALLRWNHPRLGSVSPFTFIALAEDCGLIDQLGELVLGNACRVARGWNLDTVAVNISPLQLRRSDFAVRTLDLLSEAGMDPQRLEIEITETSLIGASEISARNLKVLRDAGVKVALDDFGTGYSSLSYLMRLEVDKIKIDRSFVRHVGESARSKSIVQAMVTMAHAVGVTVTAEGVETREQQDFLVDIGCNYLQGYLLSAPLSALRMVELIANKDSKSGDSSIAAA